MLPILGLLLIASLMAPAAAGLTAEKDLDENTYYVVLLEGGTTAGVFKETNGCPGFQGGAQDCDGDGQDEEADELVDSFDEVSTLALDAWTHAVVYTLDLWWGTVDFVLCHGWNLIGVVLGGSPEPCALPMPSPP